MPCSEAETILSSLSPDSNFNQLKLEKGCLVGERPWVQSPVVVVVGGRACMKDFKRN